LIEHAAQHKELIDSCHSSSGESVADVQPIPARGISPTWSLYQTHLLRSGYSVIGFAHPVAEQAKDD